MLTMYKIESKGWCSSLANFKPYCPPDCVLTLPDDTVHITKYATRYCEHDVDIWFSPSTETVYQSLGVDRYKIITPYKPDGKHTKSSMYFYTWSFTKHRNIMIRVDMLHSKRMQASAL